MGNKQEAQKEKVTITLSDLDAAYIKKIEETAAETIIILENTVGE